MAAKHPLAVVRDITGKIIHLGMFESVKDIRVEPDLITLAINRAQSTSSRDGWRVTKRGITLYSFRRHALTDTWSLVGTVPVWWSTDETHATTSRDSDPEWEKMCYRPGNKRNPLDGPRTRTNGYRGEASR